MNTKHIHDLTLRLCQALNHNYDVINMDAVTCVISTLEGTTITKEQLEATRLAKFINHLRRRTKDESLARRAKSLLKKWREMVGIQQQQVTDTTTASLSTALPSVASHNINLQQQQRSRSISPATASAHFDAMQHHSNSNSSQTVGAVCATVESTQLRTNVAFGCLTSLPAEKGIVEVNTTNQKLGVIQGQNCLADTGLASAPAQTRKQPTSFENVLSGFAFTDNSNSGITNDTGVICHKIRKPLDGSLAPPIKAQTLIIQESSNSNSGISLILPSNTQPTSLAPIVIDVQDSNSEPSLVASIPTNSSIVKKVSITAPTQSVSLPNCNPMTALLSAKSKRLKRGKKRKNRSEYGGQDSIDLGTGSKDTNILFEENLSNQQPHHQPCENLEKCITLVNEDKSRLTYPDMLSLLDNSSMSSMFPPEGSTHPCEEEEKVNIPANTTNRTSLSTSDLTFAGKFKSNNVNSTTSCNDLIGYGMQCQTDSPKNMLMNNLSLQSGLTVSKFPQFHDFESNSTESNSISQASHVDLIDVVSRNKLIKVLQVQKKQSTSNLKSEETANILGQETIAVAIPSQHKYSHSVNNEATVLPTSNVSISEKKQPRKRGRKKGSKGVDSVIAKETSFSSQMLLTSLSSGNKKVKTTKELYAEMQNRKFGITAKLSSPTLTNWPALQPQQQVSRPASSCSEPSQQSPYTYDVCSTNATMSTIDTRSTPEKCLTKVNAGEDASTSDSVVSELSRDSSAILKQQKLSLFNDSNSNSQLPLKKFNTNSPSVADMENFDTTIEIIDLKKKLFEIVRRLAPVQSTTAIELQRSSQVLSCTCKIIEIPLFSNKLHESVKSVENFEMEMTRALCPGKNYNNVSDKQSFDEFVEKHSITDVNTDFKQSSQISRPTSLTRAKPKKSIFDPDFDDDDDPLNILKAESATANLVPANIEEIIKIEEKPELDKNKIYASEQPQTSDYKMPFEEVLAQSITDVKPMRICPTYEVEEDHLCKAKQRFELQTQMITKFHIDTLHNCFIPNINGNWDNANNTHATIAEATPRADSKIGNMTTDGYNVVPKYGSLVLEHICKDLSHLSLYKSLVPQKSAIVMEELYKIPFLGVAHSVLMKNKKRKFHKHKIWRKTKVFTNFGHENFQGAIPREDEKYTTGDEKRYNVHGTIKANQTESITENCNKTPDIGNDIASKRCTNICDLPSTNNTSNSLLQDHGANINAKKGNSSVTLKGITVDVISHDSDMFVSHSDAQIEGLKHGQNLLAIANFENYGLKSAEMNPSSKLAKRVRNTETEGNSNLLQGEVKISDDNNLSSLTHSREGSSGVSKLGCQFQEQNQLDINAKRKTRFKAYNKQPRIKRMKIAINGDMATQMRISDESSYNNSDEDDDDGNRNYEIDHDDVIGSAEADNYVSNRSTSERYNMESLDDKDGVANQRCCNDNQDINLDGYEDRVLEADADFDEFEDGEGSSSDYHEVVTRDISIASTGNNHIVLTIKKTPSKNNSSLNSLSVISPLLICHETTGSQVAGVCTSSTSSNNTKCASHANIDMDDLTAKSIEHEEEISTSTSTLSILLHKNNREIQTQSLLQTKDERDIDTCTQNLKYLDCTKNIDTNLPKRSFEVDAGSLSSISFLDLALARKQYIHKECQKMPHKSNKNKQIDAHCLRAVRQHNDLFFPHELNITDSNGIARSILNISRCSSSCEEDSKSDTDDHKSIIENTKFQIKTNSPVHLNIAVQFEKNRIETYDTNVDKNLLQQRRRLSSCSTYSNCSSCESCMEYQVKTELIRDKDFCSHLVGKIPENKKGQKWMNKRSYKDNVDTSNFSQLVSTTYSVEKNCHTATDTVNNKNVPDNANEDELSLENNGLLLSFNNIFYTSETLKVQPKDGPENNSNNMTNNTAILSPAVFGVAQQEKQKLPKKNCDDYNNFCNKSSNNINLIRYYINESSLVTHVKGNKQFNSCSEVDQQQKQDYLDIDVHNANNSNTDKAEHQDVNNKNMLCNGNNQIELGAYDKADQNSNMSNDNYGTSFAESMQTRCTPRFLPHKEYRTGLRAVDEDVDDDDGNNCARIQHFKEWHQVLQLRSYNDELLTVLPYVVFD